MRTKKSVVYTFRWMCLVQACVCVSVSVYWGHPEFPCLSLWPFLPVDRVCKVMMAAVFPIIPVLHKKSCVYCIFVHDTQQTIQKTGGII